MQLDNKQSNSNHQNQVEACSAQNFSEKVDNRPDDKAVISSLPKADNFKLNCKSAPNKAQTDNHIAAIRQNVRKESNSDTDKIQGHQDDPIKSRDMPALAAEMFEKGSMLVKLERRNDSLSLHRYSENDMSQPDSANRLRPTRNE